MIHYGDPDWDDSMFGIDERDDRPATESEAHAEWHRNSGVPMGTPGCPQDACHPEDDREEGGAQWLVDLVSPPDDAAWAHEMADAPDPDDVPF